MAANTPRSSATKRSSAAKKSSSRKPAASKSARSTNARSRASSNGTKRSSTTSRNTSSSNGNGVVDTVKSAAGKAAVPAVAVGAAAVGIAGGIALKARTRRKTVLGVKMPKSVDPKSLAKSVGHASKQFAKTSKGVSKDLERAGDQAERIGKILD